jgi:hypothetical protein
MRVAIQYRAWLFLALVLVSLNGFGQDFRKNRIESKAFKVGERPELKITNKYGSIQLISWDKDSIKMEVSIEVRAKKEAKANETFNDLSIDFTQFQSYVESKTSFDSEESFWGGMKEKTSSVFSSDNKTQVDYKVYLPGNTHLTIDNKYGDVFIGDHRGTTNIKLSNGDLKAGSFTGATTISLEFAYANIKSVENGTIYLDHRSEIKLDAGNTVKVDSRSSRLNFGDVSTLDLNSYRDKISIEKIGDVMLESSYSYFQVGVLGKRLTANMRYGSLDIDEIGPSVKKLNFTVENTDIGMIKPADRSITIEAIYSEQAGLYFPSELINKKTTKEDEEQKLVKTIGMIGESFISPIKLNITMPSGNLRIQ